MSDNVTTELSQAEVVLRMVTRPKDADGSPPQLTEDAILRDDLLGKMGRNGRRRSLSVIMLCRCSPCDIASAIKKLRRDDTLPGDPGGAAAAAGDVRAICYTDDAPALCVFSDLNLELPHHASIRFRTDLELDKTTQRLLRNRLIDVLGDVQPVLTHQQNRCK